jgi:outer membrane protein assembly factor BamB
MNGLAWRNSIGARLLSAALVVIACGAQRGIAAPGDLLYTIPNPDGEEYTTFGLVIAATDDIIVVGAPQTSVGDYTFAGRAFVFDSEDGALRYTLENPSPDTHELFGGSAAIAGGHVVVGARGIDSAAYVFDELTGEYERTLTNSDPRNDFTFSHSAIASGTNVLLGSTQHFVGSGQGAGGVFLIDPSDGELLQTYENPFPASFGTFGGRNAVAANSRHVFVGESGEPGPDGTAWGTVWACDAVTGEVAYSVLNPAPESADLPPVFDHFGLVVAADDMTLAVGAQLDDPDGVLNAGTVYVYDAATGAPRLTLQNPSPSERDQFGGALAVIDGDILVGATDDTVGELERTGTAYLFDGWTGELLLTLQNPDPETFDFFSYSVAAIGGKLIIGTPNDLPTSEVFVFEGMPERMPGDTNRDGEVNIVDLNLVRNDFGSTGYGIYGDVNRDGVVGIDDLNAVRNHFRDHSPSLPVPELGTWSMACVAVALLVGRYARRIC